MEPLRIAYLMEDTDLSGGVRVQLAQADALIERGHTVTIFTKGPPMRWCRTRAEIIHLEDFSQADLEPFDFVVGTFWTTVRPAHEMAPGRVVHLCQGYEGSFADYSAVKEKIEATYRLPIPKLVVSRSLVPICLQFSERVEYVGQIVDESFYRRAVREENEPMRVLLSGAYQIGIKGIADGYGAAVHARWRGAAFDLIRVSPWAPSREEPVDEHVQEFHVAIDTTEMTRLMHSCDILIAPSRREEGFGLPAAEAMASGLPVVMTRIPSFLSFDEKNDYAIFADEGDGEMLGEGLFDLLADEDLREETRARGREVAEQFRSARTGERLEGVLRSLLALR